MTTIERAATWAPPSASDVAAPAPANRSTGVGTPERTSPSTGPSEPSAPSGRRPQVQLAVLGGVSAIVGCVAVAEQSFGLLLGVWAAFTASVAVLAWRAGGESATSTVSPSRASAGAVTTSEAQLMRARRLESIGELTEGVAHEIITPIQYVSGNTAFLDDSFVALLEGVEELAVLARSADPEAVERCLERIDMDFIRDEVPGALEQSRDGLRRVSEIVRAMKDFSHPTVSHAPVDLNAAIASTVTVSMSEWRHVAEMDLQLDPALPLTTCHAGQVKQVVLNLIVNAAHAIDDARRADGLGRITISTEANAGVTRISVRDTGSGMTEKTRARVFDADFTTKAIGRGSGQGLSLVRRIVESHDASITVDSTVGVGSVFVVELPTEGRQTADSAMPWAEGSHR